jgi:hypothetical protein
VFRNDGFEIVTVILPHASYLADTLWVVGNLRREALPTPPQVFLANPLVFHFIFIESAARR